MTKKILILDDIDVAESIARGMKDRFEDLDIEAIIEVTNDVKEAATKLGTEKYDVFIVEPYLRHQAERSGPEAELVRSASKRGTQVIISTSMFDFQMPQLYDLREGRDFSAHWQKSYSVPDLVDSLQKKED